MIAQVASYGRSSPVKGMMARAVMPAAAAPNLQDQPQQPNPQHNVATLALASDAMTALIEAQEHLAQDAQPLVRQYTAQKIGQLIWRLDDAPVLSDAPLDVRQLKVAEVALAQNSIDVRA